MRAPLPLLEQQVSPNPNPNRNRNRKRKRNRNPSPNPKQPLLLSLGAARVQTAATYLEGYVGRERLAEFVRLHPQSLLWMPDEDTPAAQHLSMLGLPEALIKRVGRSFPALYRLESADNLEAIVLYLQQEG